MAWDKEREEKEIIEDAEALDALFGQGGLERLVDEVQKEDLPKVSAEPFQPDVSRREERKPIPLEEEESFEEELMPFLEMGIQEEEEEVSRELAKEREEGIAPKPWLEVEVPRIEVPKIEVPKIEVPKIEVPEEEVPEEEVPKEKKVIVLPRVYPLIRKALFIAASILFPLILIGWSVTLLIIHITIEEPSPSDKPPIKVSVKPLDRGILYIEQGRFNEAEREFEKGIKKKLFGRLKEYSRYGLAYLEKNEYRRAEVKFNHVLREKPKDIEANHNLIKLYLATGNSLQAREKVIYILEKVNSKDVESLFILARLAMEEVKPEEAYHLLNRALKIDPKNIKVLHGLQRVFLAQGEYDKALGVHRYVMAKLRQDKEAIDQEALTKLGISYLDRPELAENLLQTVLDYYPSNWEARFRLAQIFADSGRLDEAKTHLDTLIKDTPRSILVSGLAGEISFREGRFDEAERFLKEAVALIPQDPKNHYWLGNLYYTIGKTKEAIKAYEWASSLGFKTKDMNYNWGVALYKEKDYEEAINQWNELIKEDEENPILNYNLGNAYVHIHNWPEAKERYERTIAVYHRKLKAAELAGKSGKLENILCLELGKVYNNIGVVYEKLNLEDEAFRSYAKALEYASWGRQEDMVAYQNLNRLLRNMPIERISQAIHLHLKPGMEG